MMDINYYILCINADYHKIEEINEQGISKHYESIVEHYHTTFDCYTFKQYPKADIFEWLSSCHNVLTIFRNNNGI